MLTYYNTFSLSLFYIFVVVLLSWKLANSQASSLEELDQEEHQKIGVVKTLYEALNSHDVQTVHRLLACDLEWWFHGPPAHQHLMHILTGSTSSSSKSKSFLFIPLSIVAFGSTIIVEGGQEGGKEGSWVHAWTVTDGIFTQVREYFNTSVTVTWFGTPEGVGPSGRPQEISSLPAVIKANCQSVWESKLCDNKSVPGLVLAL